MFAKGSKIQIKFVLLSGLHMCFVYTLEKYSKIQKFKYT